MMTNLPPTWAADIQAVTRWVQVDAIANEAKVLLFRRVLGWDESRLPDWVEDVNGKGIRIAVTHLPGGVQFSSDDEATGLVSQGTVRRLEPWQASFLNQEPTASHWGLQVPCVVYEVWCNEQAHEAARAAWMSLSEDDQAFLRDSDVGPSHVRSLGDIGGAGYAGSTMIHVPQIRPYLTDLGRLVLPGGVGLWGRLTLVSTALDGTATLGSAASELNLEPWRELDATEPLPYIAVHCPDASFEAMNRAATAEPRYLAAEPNYSIVGLGAGVEHVLVPQHGPPCRLKWGLVKSVGITIKIHHGPNTRPLTSKHLVRVGKEPWAERVPQFAHSRPSETHHIPPRDAKAIRNAFRLLATPGSPTLICDPYATKKGLERALPTGARCKLLTTLASHDALGGDWSLKSQIETRIISDKAGDPDGVHDRFILGPEAAFIMGTSLSGIGKRHSFIIQADNSMRWVLREVFEHLWTAASTPQEARAARVVA